MEKKYFKITCSNNYCGCDEEFYVKENENEIDDIADEILTNYYSFFEPDDRFIDTDDDEAYEDYQENCCVDYEEITEEEYLENK